MKSTTWKSQTVTSWFRTTCPPCLDETIQLLGNGAFTDNWFNTKYDLKLTKTDLVDLLSVATKEHLFLFNGALYEKTDCVAMGSSIGPLPYHSYELESLVRICCQMFGEVIHFLIETLIYQFEINIYK